MWWKVYGDTKKEALDGASFFGVMLFANLRLV